MSITEDRIADITRQVSLLVSGTDTADDGGGEYLHFASRTGDGGPGDQAFIIPEGDGEGAGFWQFQTEDYAEPDAEGHYNGVVRSDLTAESDPAQVAAWIEQMAERFGSVRIA